MRFKGTLVLLIVCLALGAFVYFYEIKGGERRQKEKEAENQLWKLDSKAIQQIEFISPNAYIAATRNGEKDWRITAPRSLEADSEELDRVANSAANIRRESLVEQNASDLTQFGLNPARTSFKLKTKDGKEYSVSFGNNNPTGNSAYARMSNSNDVFLVASSVATVFDKKLNDLRNHAILSFEQPEVLSLNIKNPKGILRLVKDSNDRWWIEDREKIAADSPDVRGMLNALSFGRIKEFFDEDPAEYANLGLDKPFIDVVLTYGKNKGIKHLVIGEEKAKLRKKTGKSRIPGTIKTNGGDNAEKSSTAVYLAKDESRSDLFFVEKDLVDKLMKSAADLRDKALAPFQRWDIDSIALTNTKGSFGFTKSSGEWFLGEKKKKVKWDAINAILDAMEKPIKEWIDKPAPLSTYGLDKPAMHIVLKQGPNVIVDCSFGRAAKSGIYAQLKGSSFVKIADPEGLEALDKGEADLIETPPPPAAPKK